MKILKAGKRKDTAEVICHTCHSVLEITQGDVQPWQQYNDIGYYVICPVCGDYIDVSPAGLFPWVD